MAASAALLLLWLASCCSAAEDGQRHDVSALVQGSLRMHLTNDEGRPKGSITNDEGSLSGSSDEEEAPSNTTTSVLEVPGRPVAITKLGKVRGIDAGSYSLFGGIPYAEKPGRFEVAQPKKPWHPETLDATQFGLACIGARTDVPEGEDCLHLNIWVPRGERKNMPVIVYFHGGMNQHGSGSEAFRRGDGITQSRKFPTIFINFDFRLGIYGWIDMEGTDIPANIAVRDQQAALRWVKDNIAAFGGDPNRVTLQGQSEGCSTILVHMTAPGSQGLFSRVVLHSPVADMWSRNANKHRTEFMIKRSHCGSNNVSKTVACLKRMNENYLWSMDWVSEELSRNPGNFMWLRNMWGLTSFTMKAKDKQEVVGELGWHPVIDGEIIPGEPRELIQQGRFSKVPVLITVSKNETYGVLPNGAPESSEKGLKRLLKKGDLERMKIKYAKTLQETGITISSEGDLVNQMLTDKLWTCDARWLARDVTAGGGKGYVGLFWHEPRYDPIGIRTSAICANGATCHASEMLYVLPQGGDRGIHGPGMEREIKFSKKYSDAFLAFVHGDDEEHPWQAWNETHPITFFDSSGARVVPNYRSPQCTVLDKSMGQYLPDFMREIPRRTL
mmetsp:Transcript_48480/g.144816  ORF Transcript_48480/g.144816 Transcript_48480/m.144816 type:complete len:613 (-) Transcript_48480:1034-2872(-)